MRRGLNSAGLVVHSFLGVRPCCSRNRAPAAHHPDNEEDQRNHEDDESVLIGSDRRVGSIFWLGRLPARSEKISRQDAHVTGDVGVYTSRRQ